MVRATVHALPFVKHICTQMRDIGRRTHPPVAHKQTHTNKRTNTMRMYTHLAVRQTCVVCTVTLIIPNLNPSSSPDLDRDPDPIPNPN
eukprot:5287017-Pleurochrysis_carterae.AAC.1